AGSERSAWKACDRPPAAVIAEAVSSAGRLLPCTATAAPACASAWAIAAPRPVAEPVTRATLWSRRNWLRMLGWFVVMGSAISLCGDEGGEQTRAFNMCACTAHFALDFVRYNGDRHSSV